MTFIGSRRVSTARKQYPCMGCRDKIEPGQRYVRLSELLTQEPDVDEFGRTFGIDLPRAERKWYMIRVHINCEGEYLGYGY